MNKIDFLDLDIDAKLNYLNEKLSEGQTVIRIREDLGIGEKLLQKIMKEAGCKYSQQERAYFKCTTHIPQSMNIAPNNLDYKHNINILQEYKNDLIDLINAKEDILNIIKEHKEGTYYKDTTNIIEVVARNSIDIKNFETSARATSVRIYDETLEKWKKFCSENKKYSNQDLLSMALEEYMDKYSS